jgi:arginase family enzyme
VTVGPVDNTVVPRFAGPPTFAQLPRLDEVGRADVAVLGVPFDASVSYRPGARFGPAHVRACSKLLRPYNPGLDVEPFARLQVADAGDLAVNPFDIESAVKAIHAGAGDLEHMRVAEFAERIQARVADRPVYVSVDIDVLDPAHAPGTGTPEAGGLTSRELLAVLRHLAGTNVVGADIVEVSPAYDHAESTGIAAAHVAYELISIFAIKGDRI